jgi:Protein of unknown function (DUF3987)/DnaB-like helicase N terminal domain
MSAANVQHESFRFARRDHELPDRLPPSDVEAEKRCLANMLREPSTVAPVLDVIRDGDFSIDDFQCFCRAIRALHNEGTAVNGVTVIDRLRKWGLSKMAMGADPVDTIADICQSVEYTSLDDALAYAKIVHDEAVQRELMEAAADLLHKGYSGRYTAPQLLQQLTSKIEAVHVDAEPSPQDEFALHPMPAKMGKEAFRGFAGEIVDIIESQTEACKEAILSQFIISFANRMGRRPHWAHDATTHKGKLFGCLVGPSGCGKGMAWNMVKWLLRRCDLNWDESAVLKGLASGEGLIRACSEDDGPVLVVEPEFGQVLSTMKRDGNSLGYIIRDLYDSDELRNETSKNPVHVKNAYVSIIAHVTSADLKIGLNGPHKDNGFGNRFVYVNVYQSKSLPEGGDLASIEQALEPLFQHVIKALTYAERSPDFNNDVCRDEQASKRWKEVYDSLRHRPPGDHGNMTKRAAPMVMTLAMIYAVLDRKCRISLAHLDSALAFWEYCDQTALYLFGEPRVDKRVSKLVGLLDEMKTGLTRTEINRKIGYGRLKPHQLDAVIAECCASGKYVYKQVSTQGANRTVIMHRKYAE